MGGARDQARGRPSGGSSRREARRAGRTHEEGAGRKPRERSGPGGPTIASVAALPTWKRGEPVGSPDSPHGAAFRQGLASSSSPTEDGASGGGGTGRTGTFPWPQQQEAPRHFERHLQRSECESASTSHEAEDACASPHKPKRPRSSMTAGRSRRDTRGRTFSGPSCTEAALSMMPDQTGGAGQSPNGRVGKWCCQGLASRARPDYFRPVRDDWTMVWPSRRSRSSMKRGRARYFSRIEVRSA